MKYLLRLFIFQIVGLWFATQVIPTIVVIGSWQTLVVSGIVLGFLMLFVKPILKILFIPINFLTFGLLSWFINVVIVFLLTLIMPQVQIKTWTFPGLSYAGFLVPEMHLNYLGALIVSALLITFITNVLEFVANE